MTEPDVARGDAGDGTYLAVHLHEALLSDGRVGEQDLQVDIAGGAVRVTGSVATTARREAVDVVVAEHAPGWVVRNDVRVVPTTDPPDRESLP